jgi:hypothetical protein
LFPFDNWLPLTVSGAVALPPDPDNVATPSTLWPTAKVTDPVGDVVPEPALTVAVRAALPLDAKVAGLASTAVVVGLARFSAQCVVRL